MHYSSVCVMTAMHEEDTLTIENKTYCWYDDLQIYSWCPDKSNSTNTVSLGEVKCCVIHTFIRLALGLDFEFPQNTTNELDNSECFSIKNGLDLRPREYKITV